jgi:hypothetical protein
MDTLASEAVVKGAKTVACPFDGCGGATPFVHPPSHADSPALAFKRNFSIIYHLSPASASAHKIRCGQWPFSSLFFVFLNFFFEIKTFWKNVCALLSLH